MAKLTASQRWERFFASKEFDRFRKLGAKQFITASLPKTTAELVELLQLDKKRKRAQGIQSDGLGGVEPISPLHLAHLHPRVNDNGKVGCLTPANLLIAPATVNQSHSNTDFELPYGSSVAKNGSRPVPKTSNDWKRYCKKHFDIDDIWSNCTLTPKQSSSAAPAKDDLYIEPLPYSKVLASELKRLGIKADKLRALVDSKQLASDILTGETNMTTFTQLEQDHFDDFMVEYFKPAFNIDHDFEYEPHHKEALLSKYHELPIVTKILVVLAKFKTAGVYVKVAQGAHDPRSIALHFCQYPDMKEHFSGIVLTQGDLVPVKGEYNVFKWSDAKLKYFKERLELTKHFMSTGKHIETIEELERSALEFETVPAMKQAVAKFDRKLKAERSAVARALGIATGAIESFQ
ncbi:hypothetical protein [Vibrio bathopelagicus]